MRQLREESLKVGGAKRLMHTSHWPISDVHVRFHGNVREKAAPAGLEGETTSNRSWKNQTMVDVTVLSARLYWNGKIF